MFKTMTLTVDEKLLRERPELAKKLLQSEFNEAFKKLVKLPN